MTNTSHTDTDSILMRLKGILRKILKKIVGNFEKKFQVVRNI